MSAECGMMKGKNDKQMKTDQDLKNTYVILLPGVKSGPDDQSEGLEIRANGV
jgi:hypothetical protein